MEIINIEWKDKKITVYGYFREGQEFIPYKQEGIAPSFDIEKVLNNKYKEMDLIISEYLEIEQLVINQIKNK